MAELLTIAVFFAMLVACAATGVPVFVALAAGLALFAAYGLRRGRSARELVGMAREGMRSIAPIAAALLVIGALTASWRSAGTIPYIVARSAELLSPASILPASFLLNAAVSTMTGTSFGTAATMGVICKAMADAMGVPPVLSGGAIVSGAFVGDRCSPISTSANLVCAITRTGIYRNLRLMAVTGAVPLLLTLVVYAAAGAALSGGPADVPDVGGMFSREFELRAFAAIPAVVLLVMAAVRRPLLVVMASSIAAAAAVAVALQGMAPESFLKSLVFGYEARDRSIAHVIDGGGAVSMAGVCLIVLTASTYPGIFRGTGLTRQVKSAMPRLAARLSRFGAIVAASVFTSALACNQVLAVMLTRDICSDIEPDPQRMAIALENSAILIPALVPWSIAGAVPIANIGAPTSCLFAACFLYLVPLWGIAAQRRHRALMA